MNMSRRIYHCFNMHPTEMDFVPIQIGAENNFMHAKSHFSTAVLQHPDQENPPIQ